MQKKAEMQKKGRKFMFNLKNHTKEDKNAKKNFQIRKIYMQKKCRK